VAGHQFVAEMVDGRRIVSVVIRRLARVERAAPQTNTPSAGQAPEAQNEQNEQNAVTDAHAVASSDGTETQ